jgi:hypothetical protein
VSGVITAEPGRLLDERHIVIQDAGAGIPVRLPPGVDRDAFTRGRTIRVTGTIASPYANQELRPAKAADIELLGMTSDPAAVDRLGSALGETVEGTLARVAGTIEKSDASGSGSITVVVEDESGEIRVFLHAGSGAQREKLKPGMRLVAVGVVGQRESAGGAGDGYRLWPRDIHDLVVTAGPGPPPRPDHHPGTHAATDRHSPARADRDAGAACPSHQGPRRRRHGRDRGHCHHGCRSARRGWPADRGPGRVGRDHDPLAGGCGGAPDWHPDPGDR